MYISAATAPASFSDPLAIYGHFLAKGFISMQQCEQCKTFRFPPANICASCGSDQYNWQPLSGRGTIWSFCVFHKDYFPKTSRKIPYAVVLIQLKEGPKVFSNMVGVDVNSLQIGLPVRAIFEDQPNAETLLRFGLADGAI